jgi:optic atrophy 3 protein
MAQLPLMKIFVLLFKEAAKPIAARLKQSAKEHEKFRTYTMVIGRFYERATQRVEVWSLGFRVKQFKEITDAHALTVGADVISQTFLVSVAVILLVLEYWRGNKASAAAAAKKQQEKAARQTLKEARLAQLDNKLAELSARILALETEAIGRDSAPSQAPSNSPRPASQIAQESSPLPTESPAAASDSTAVKTPIAAAPTLQPRTWASFARDSWSWLTGRRQDGLGTETPASSGAALDIAAVSPAIVPLQQPSISEGDGERQVAQGAR